MIGREYVVADAPKTFSGFRTLLFNSEVLKILNEFKEITFNKGLYDKSSYIFVDTDGSRLRIESIYKAMRKISEKLGLPMVKTIDTYTP